MEEKNRPTGLLYGLGFCVFPVIVFYLMEAYEHNPFTEVRSEAQIFNIILFELIAWVLYLLIGRMQTALRIELVLALVFGITNHYVMQFRSTPFVPWDIFSIGTAASVVGNYRFTVSVRFVLVTLGFVVLITLVGFLKNAPKIEWKPRLAGAVLTGLVLCLFVNTLQDDEFQTRHYLYPFLFTPGYMTQVNGMAVTFAMNLEYVIVDKPEGYRAADAEKILESYEKETEVSSEQLPNIIVIMDEAFSDLAVLGELQTNEDYMPFMHRMQQGEKNTITGYVQVSVCGGNTANSEFEFLTGDTMAFLPNGSIPYQQYVKRETPSLASYLKSLGYETYAQHPYRASGWNREQVYPLLGFEYMDFLPDYKVNASDLLRGYVSDEADMRHIIDTFENKDAGKPAFIFNVTMQNHGGYQDTYDDFTNDIHAQYDSEPLDQYLSLIYRTDQALENLVEYFSDVDEKTVIVFFGDHQPGNAVASVVSHGTEDDAERYQVPYLIWANYDIQGEQNRNTSLNYLSAQVLQAAGVPTDAYQNYLLELSRFYPVLSAAGRTEKTGADEESLLTYRKLQYYNLFEGEKK